MTHKGFSLLETALVLMIMTVSMICVSTHTNFVEEVRFNTLVRQVESGIISAQYMATATGREYNVLCTQKTIYIRPGYRKAVYVFDMGRHVSIPRNITGKYISFPGGMAPSKAGTIELINTALSKKARITVRIATGKTTIYFEKL
jgi:hypothetical protein